MSSVKPVPINPAPAPANPVGESPTVAGAASGPASVPVPALSAVEIARAARARRARRLVRNLALWVGLPTLLGILYFGVLAIDQYESFSVLSVPADKSPMLREYVLSRDMLGKLEQGAQFSQKFAGRGGDLFEELGRGAGTERRYRFFLHKVEVQVEEAGIFRLKVRALSGADAAQFAQLMVAELGTFLASHSADPAAKLVVVSAPSRPNEPTYPHRLYGVITVALVSAALYAIGSLLVAAAREHAQF
jgi:capsule polysaccharide export protein KpsE/RkpR